MIPSKIKAFFQNHQYKIILGAPIIFLLLINTGMIGGSNVFLLHAEKSIFVGVGERISVHLEMSTKSPVNAVGGTLLFSTEHLVIDSFSRETSIIDLWVEEPLFSNSEGTLRFSGGIIPDTNEAGVRGDVLTVFMRAVKSGKVLLTIKDGELLAANGEGTNIFSGSNTLTLYISEQGKPSPDVNADGALSLADVNTLYLKTFRAYDARYDFTGDGKVSWGDVRLLLSLL